MRDNRAILSDEVSIRPTNTFLDLNQKTSNNGRNGQGRTGRLVGESSDNANDLVLSKGLYRLEEDERQEEYHQRERRWVGA